MKRTESKLSELAQIKALSLAMCDERHTAKTRDIYGQAVLKLLGESNAPRR